MYHNHHEVFYGSEREREERRRCFLEALYPHTLAMYEINGVGGSIGFSLFGTVIPLSKYLIDMNIKQ